MATMQITDYHAKYFAHELTKRCSSESVEKLAGVLVDAQVDLNPHQVEAALFAFRSPLSKGALLADEVGLGKTIEAGLVISQKWAERKRRILIITPSNLRKQWHQELQEKFFLPCRILETKSYKDLVKQGETRPIDTRNFLTICSYQFARTKADEIQETRWDLVVIDEAHRLRNVYKPSNIIANTLKRALKNSSKLLLTATPLQNSLLELYGLVSFIDEHTFGDLKSFRDQFANLNDQRVFETLKSRLKPVCHRTLRRQVTAYVPYTRRHSIVQTFTPQESEDQLYHLVSEYLQRENLQALPRSQRSLMTLVLRKLLASSTFAIAHTLGALSRRLQTRTKHQPQLRSLEEELIDDYEALDETVDEWTEEITDGEPLTDDNQVAIEREIADLESFRQLAVSITHNSKGDALLTALDRAFADAERLNAARKAIIFTESRQTQEYLLRLLSQSRFSEGIVLFNGSNSDEKSKQIYQDWLKRHTGTDQITGSKTADMRSALVDYFREEGQIMIATEAGSEGINLQFCSLVVNYDLPWNPQRIEQRIGRCHRYGQKHDVVVVNFLNQNNEADQRVFELLSEKFSLFDGVFGSSDEVLGAVESGVDFEKRIADIYQRCRTPEEIKASFDELQLELSSQINAAMTRTRQQLLENFDTEVHEKLRVNLGDSNHYLNRYEQLLMELTKHELGTHASFRDTTDASSFELRSAPFEQTDTQIPLGLYELPRRSREAHIYRLSHPLAEQILDRAKSRSLPLAELVFDYTSHHLTTEVLKPYIGQSGELVMELLTIESLNQSEDRILVAAVTDDGQILEEEPAQKLFLYPAQTVPLQSIPPANLLVQQKIKELKSKFQQEVSHRNLSYFEAENEKLESWAEDQRVALERDIKDMDRQIKEAKRAATLALTLEEKLAGQKHVKALEATRNSKRRSLFDAQDEVEHQREQLITQIENQLTQKMSLTELFSIRWRLV